MIDIMYILSYVPSIFICFLWLCIIDTSINELLYLDIFDYIHL